MRIGIPAEIYPGETRVAATPETVKKLALAAATPSRCSPARARGASHPGRRVPGSRRGAVVQPGGHLRPVRHRPQGARPEAVRAAAAAAREHRSSACSAPHEGVEPLAQTGVTAFAMELLPRITRAQAMDVLSSQGNIAGYKAVIVAVQRVRPLHADADDRRRHGQGGARADPRRRRRRACRPSPPPSASARSSKPSTCGRPSRSRSSRSAPSSSKCRYRTRKKRAAETAGGYAREMSDDYKQRQAALIAERAKAADIVITTALIPGRPAPLLITRGHGQGDEARFGHRRPGRQAGRQLRAQRGGPRRRHNTA